MADLTVAELKAKFGSDIPVPLPDGSGTWRCRKPDFQDVMFRHVIPMPLFQQMLQELSGAADTADDLTDEQKRIAAIEQFMANAGDRTATFINQWIALAAKTPAIVMTSEEADRDPNALWVLDVPLAVRVAIFNATFELPNVRRRQAAGEFRPQPASPDVGPPVAPVSGGPPIGGTGGD